MVYVREYQRKTKGTGLALMRQRLANVAEDVIFFTDGSYRARKSFFYTHGYTAKKFEEAIKEAIPEAKIINSGEHWAPFRGGASLGKQSFWYVDFMV